MLAHISKSSRTFFYETSWCSDNFWHSTFGNRSATALKPICNWSPTIKFCTLVVYGRSFFRISERPFGRRRNRWAILVSFYIFLSNESRLIFLTQPSSNLPCLLLLSNVVHAISILALPCSDLTFMIFARHVVWNPPPPNLPLQLYDFHILVI